MSRTPWDWFRPVLVLLFATVLAGCAKPMSLEVQKEHIQRHDFPVGQLTPDAFLQAWGNPPYLYEGTTRFFPANGQYVPHFRVPLGEAPENWDSSVISGFGRFFAYPEQGELLGFLDDRLVYREAMPAPQVHAIGKAWANERKFRTTIETDTAKPR